MPTAEKKSVRVCVAALLFCAAFTTSCVYFNTMYNARRIFSETEKKREKGNDVRGLEDDYEKVVVKCSKILQNNPDSRWADDAAFLLGRSLFWQGEYSKSEKKFQEIMANWPKSEYTPISLYWLARIYEETREYTKALDFTTRFLDRYPEHEDRFRVKLLAGAISLELDQREEALRYYSDVIENAEDDDLVEEAMLSAADLHLSFDQWGEAAEYYEEILGKGITWERRYEASLPLGRCYIEMGRCHEAVEIYDGLLLDVKERTETPPILLGKAGGYLCEDSLSAAKEYYEEVIGKFPKTVYSAEACYRLGTLYHDKADSLEKAREYFARVGKEDASSEFATEALKKANSIGRLIEFGKIKDGEATDKQKAEKMFYSAEIQMEQFGRVQRALDNYIALLDSFPATEIAPKAAYAVGWIYKNRLEEDERALEAFRKVVKDYPRSSQAAGALEKIEKLGGLEMRSVYQAYVDSVSAIPVDTFEAVEDSASAAELAEGDSTAAMEAAPAVVPADGDSTAAGEVPAAAEPAEGDSISAVEAPAAAESAPTLPGSVSISAPDSAGKGIPGPVGEPADTSRLEPTARVEFSPSDSAKAQAPEGDTEPEDTTTTSAKLEPPARVEFSPSDSSKAQAPEGDTEPEDTTTTSAGEGEK